MDTVHECDRQTDRQTDRRTDRITITKTVQTASHFKKPQVDYSLVIVVETVSVLTHPSRTRPLLVAGSMTLHRATLNRATLHRAYE